MTSPDIGRRRLLFTTGALGALGATAAIPSSGAPGPRRKWGAAALVVHNARVLTGEPGAPPREAIAVGRDGNVLATGPSAVVRRHAGRDTEVVDAAGATVMSGIVDGHAHPVGAAVRSLKLSLEHRSFTVDELLDTLRGHLTEKDERGGGEPDGWLEFVDWNPVGLLPAGTVPHHRLLAALPTRRPVALLGADGHVAWVNQRALDLAGITRGTPDPPGGTIVRDPDGSPTGLLKDDALYAVTRQIPGPEGDRLHTACARMFARAAAQGVTSFLDAACTDWELGVYAALASSGRLPQRIATALRLDPEEVADPPEALSWLRDARKEFGDIPKVSVRTAKVFLDGVIEHPTQSAALIDPYLDGDGRLTGRRGDLFADAAAFGRLAVLLDRHGFQLHAHAIGDRAVRTALDGYERALRANGPRGNRHTVAHLQLVHPDDLPRFARLGVVACMQLQWAVRNAWTVDALLPYLGERRHRLLYPARSLERHGAVLAGGSDWPVDPLAVWNQIRTAVDREGTAAEQGALHPGLEGLARAAALRMHTEGAARQLRIDHRVGRLTPGRAADLIVLDRDVTRIPVREIGDTQVRLTLVGGRTVFDAETEEGKAVRADSVLSSLGSSAPPVSSASPASPVSAASAVSPASAGPGPYADRHRACGCPRTAGRGTTARL